MSQDQTPQPSPFETLPEAATQKLHAVLEFFIDNFRLVVAGAFLVLAAVAAGSAFNSWRASAQRAALDELTKLSAKGDIAALAAFAENAPAGARAGALVELARLAMAKKDYPAAAKAWRAVSEQAAPGMATVAVLGQAEALRLAGKASEAVDILKAAQQSAPESFRPILLRSKALAAEQAGNAAEAAAAWQELLAASKDSPRDAEFVKHKLSTLQQAAPAAKS